MMVDRPGAPLWLGKYELLREQGGTTAGTVWFARSAVDGSLLTIARVHRHLLKKPEVADAFLAEVKPAEGFRHANVLGLVDAGYEEGELYAASEHHEGELLSNLVSAAGPQGLPQPVVLRVCLDVLAGLSAAHARAPGLFHGELDPHQVLVGVDGVARMAGLVTARALARIQTPVGVKNQERLGYAAPERVKAMASATGAVQAPALDARPDVFSMGVLLWECLAKQRLFASKIEVAVVQKVMSGPIAPLVGMHGLDVPPELDAAVQHALQRDPDKRMRVAAMLTATIEGLGPGRIATALEVASLVERLAGKAIAARRIQPPRQAVASAPKAVVAEPQVKAKVAPPKPAAPAPAPAPAPKPVAKPLDARRTLLGIAAPVLPGVPVVPAIHTPKPVPGPGAPVVPASSASKPVPVTQPAPVPAVPAPVVVREKTPPPAPAPAWRRDDDDRPPPAVHGPVPSRRSSPTASDKRTLMMGSPVPLVQAPQAPPVAPVVPAPVAPVVPAPAAPASQAVVDTDKQAASYTARSFGVAVKPSVAEPKVLIGAPAPKAAPVELTGAANLDEIGPGSALGRYEILMPVARGGMASVWIAKVRGADDGKVFAIKTMLPDVSDDPDFEDMFIDEGRVAARIHHPNVVEIVEVGEEEELLYMVMEWIDGESIAALVKAAKPLGGVPLPIVLRVASRIAAGLHAAHELRDDHGNLLDLVHRDISPANVLLTTTGVVKIVDFGIAKSKGRLHQTRVGGIVKGKTPYLSPEQLVQVPVDRRSDIFSLGVLLYVLTTGLHPFRGETDAKTVENIALRTPVPLCELLPTTPPAFEAVVLKALEKKAGSRFATAAEMQRAIDEAAAAAGCAATDEDVAAFLEKALGESIEKRAQELRAALGGRAPEVASAPAFTAPEHNMGPGPAVPAQVTFGAAPVVPAQVTFGAAPVVPAQVSFGAPPPPLAPATPVMLAAAAPAPRKRGPGAKIAITAAVGVCVLLGGVALLLGARRSDPPPVRQGAPAESASAPAESASAAPTPAPSTPAGEATASGAVSAQPAATPGPPPSARPPGARPTHPNSTQRSKPHTPKYNPQGI